MARGGRLQGTECELRWLQAKFWCPAVMSISLLCACFILSSLVIHNNSVYSKIGKRLSNLWDHQKYLNVSCRREAEENWSCCPTPWRLFESSCYFISTTLQPWNESRESCAVLQANLAVICTQEEQNFIIQNLDTSSAYWVGLSDPEGLGNWQWVDQMPYDTNATFWHPGEPNWPDERCVVVSFRSDTGRWGWNNIHCHLPQKLVCRVPAVHL